SAYPESSGEVYGYTAQDPSLTIQSPRDLINGTDGATTRLCLNRGLIQSGNIDCDYASVVRTATGSAMFPLNGDYANSPAPYGLGAVDAASSAASGRWVSSTTVFQASSLYDTTRTYIPLQLTYNAGATAEGACTITSYEPAYTKAILTMVQADSPYCGVSPGTVLGSSSLSLPTGGQYIGLGRLIDFGQICVDYEKTVKLTVQVGAKATCGATTNLLRYKTVVVSPIQYRNSCFARGTPVVRANGQPDAIENFKVGDKLIANDKGLILTVTGVSSGVERSAMVRLQDDKGHDALVTLTHPVVTTNRGIVRAEDLKVEDRLVTREGPAILTSLTRELYQDTVYNLAVGTPEELARAGPQDRTLYAGGILMGDYHMQAELDAQRARPSAAQASIPADWLVDYVKSQAPGASR
ncbi:MAG TPA: Hint domain-containing protein, partial [Archangium sp.]|nr:Hint domain-containing protein [Archangium sp.]